MTPDDILAQVERTLAATPRTGLHHALVRMSAITGDADDAAQMEARISATLRSDDLVQRDGTEITVLLRGVQDLPNALHVARRLAALAGEVAPTCAGVTLLNRGESSLSVSLRAQGALDLAMFAGPGSVVSSPPLPA